MLLNQCESLNVKLKDRGDDPDDVAEFRIHGDQRRAGA